MADRFRLQQHDDGQVYLHDELGRGLHVDFADPATPRVQVGSTHTMVIDKVYGPLVGFAMRITIDSGTAEWVVERHARGEVWEPAARIPLQLESDFDEEVPGD